MISDHWFRTNSHGEPCVLLGCGKAEEEHVEACGEWMDPRHLFVPSVRQPGRCRRCERMWAHSTHHGSRKNRSLHHADLMLRWRDRLLRRGFCWHLSRFKWPCWRLSESCRGLCEKHFDEDF